MQTVICYLDFEINNLADEQRFQKNKTEWAPSVEL